MVKFCLVLVQVVVLALVHFIGFLEEPKYAETKTALVMNFCIILTSLVGMVYSFIS